MTSPPRKSYSSVMIETIFDFKYYLDKISEFMLATFEKEESQEQKIQKLHVQVKTLQLQNKQLMEQQRQLYFQMRPEE